MGKNLIQQRRGRGSPTYRSPSFRFAGEVKHAKIEGRGIIRDLIKCQGHSAPLMIVEYEEGYNLGIAPEGVLVGEEIVKGKDAKIKPGNTLALKDIPEGTQVYNVEAIPGDGGRFVRSSGGAARVVAKTGDNVTLRLPSKKDKIFNANCLACIGTVAGGGRTEKPFLKAGNKHYKMKAKNKLWPSVSGTSMNAVDHPFGGSKSSHKGRPTQSPRNAPPGRKVGKIAPRRTGKQR